MATLVPNEFHLPKATTNQRISIAKVLNDGQTAISDTNLRYEVTGNNSIDLCFFLFNG